MHLYHVVDLLLIVVLALIALIVVGTLTRRIRFVAVDSVVKGKYITEYIVAFCKPGQARIVVTEWVSGRKREVEARD